MRTFVITIFFLQAIGVLVKMFHMQADYPRRETKGLGYDVCALAEYIVIAAWAAYLAWGQA